MNLLTLSIVALIVAACFALDCLLEELNADDRRREAIKECEIKGADKLALDEDINAIMEGLEDES